VVTIANFTSSICARGSHYFSSYNAKNNCYFMRGFLFLAAMIALTLKIEIIFIIIGLNILQIFLLVKIFCTFLPCGHRMVFHTPHLLARIL